MPRPLLSRLALVVAIGALVSVTLAGAASAALPAPPPVAVVAPSSSPASTRAVAGGFSPGSPTGPDVSKWQHTNGLPIDWWAVRSAGHSFAFVKATDGAGASLYVNPWFRPDFDGAGSVGLYRGSYHFARPQLPLSSAADQGRAYAAVVGTLHGPLDLPPVLDLEITGGLSAPDLVAWTHVWLDTVEQLTGRTPMIYSGPAFWSSAMGGTTQFNRYYLWQAQWTPPLTSFGAWPRQTFWQYTSSGAVPGIAGNVDLSRFNGSVDDLARLAATVTAPALDTDGTFITSVQTHEVYRMAGGAPIYVSTFAPFGDVAVVEVDQAYINWLPKVPADGTALVAAQRGEVYIVAGGAPVYTSSVAPIVDPTWTAVDAAAIDRGGQSGKWSHLRSTPADGAAIVGIQRGEIYLVAGGAPIYTSSVAPVGSKVWTLVDSQAIDQAGRSGKWSHLRSTPTDGTVVVGQQRGEVYIVAGGAPVYASTTAPIDPARPWTPIDVQAVDRAGEAGRWSHLAAMPADGTVLVSQQRGEVYIVAGGAPIYTSTTSPISADATWTPVDANAIDQAGSGLWDHLRAQPADGTVLVGDQRGEVYIVAGGAPVYTSSTAPIMPGAHWTRVDVKALDQAGASRQWNHLSMYPASGTILRAVPSSMIYVVNTTGQPQRSAATVSGPAPTAIDGQAIANAGHPSPWNHLAA